MPSSSPTRGRLLSLESEHPSQFPRPSRARHPSIPDRARSGDEWAPDAAPARANLHPQDPEMESGAPSGHRRRRSSLMNSVDPGPRGSRRAPTTRSPSKRSRTGNRIKEEVASTAGSDEDSRSTSEDVELDNLTDDGLQDDEETGLTKKGKERRKERRRKNTLLDQRITGEVKITPEEKKEADQNVLKKSLINAFLIALWYLFSLSISLYNKWMFDPKHLNFRFPLFTTCLHMLVQFTLASLVLYFLPRFRPRYDSISNPHNSRIADEDMAQHEMDSKKPLMTKMFYFTRIGPCGMATGLDIGLGNMSLKFITLTFYTMCKSSSLAFVLLFAFLFRLETPSWRLVGIIATMTAGVIMMVAGEVDFKPLGFILVISAAFFSGFRWGLTQILLLRNPATSNPFSSIFYLAPIMFLSLFIIAIPVEGFPSLFQGLSLLVDQKGSVLGPLILLFPGVIAFLMTSSEFALLQRTSVVTLSIAGIFKEVVTITASGLVFHDLLTLVNISGLVVTIGAITAYNWIKIQKMREEAQLEAHIGHAAPKEESGSDADFEGDSDLDEGPYITSDGDFLPNPNAFGLENGDGSRSGSARSASPVKKDLVD
ncbi:hypothetical protein B7494_g6389 [Chlorociboria aeruginascens]|nr:hypothetical protein B7494_g6389 [Chlorociboria aeruginascens]